MAKKNIKKANKKATAKTKKPAAKKAVAKKSAVKKPAVKAKAAKKSVQKKAVNTSKTVKAVKKPAKSISKTASKTSSKPAAKVSAKVVKAVPVKKTSKIDFKNWVTPLDDRILVQIASEERTTPGGLFIPDTVADVSGNFKGNVVAVGRGHLDKKGRVRPLDVKTGDVVVFSQFSGSEIEYQGEKVIFIRESDVLGIVNK